MVSASSLGGMGGKRFGPFQFYVGSGSHCGRRKALSRVHHLAIIKQVINIFLRRMVRKQAADDCHEITARTDTFMTLLCSGGVSALQVKSSGCPLPLLFSSKDGN